MVITLLSTIYPTKLNVLLYVIVPLKSRRLIKISRSTALEPNGKYKAVGNTLPPIHLILFSPILISFMFVKCGLTNIATSPSVCWAINVNCLSSNSPTWMWSVPLNETVTLISLIYCSTKSDRAISSIVYCLKSSLSLGYSLLLLYILNSVVNVDSLDLNSTFMLFL